MYKNNIFIKIKKIKDIKTYKPKNIIIDIKIIKNSLKNYKYQNIVYKTIKIYKHKKIYKINYIYNLYCILLIKKIINNIKNKILVKIDKRLSFDNKKILNEIYLFLNICKENKINKKKIIFNILPTYKIKSLIKKLIKKKINFNIDILYIPQILNNYSKYKKYNFSICINKIQKFNQYTQNLFLKNIYKINKKNIKNKIIIELSKFNFLTYKKNINYNIKLNKNFFFIKKKKKNKKNKKKNKIITNILKHIYTYAKKRKKIEKIFHKILKNKKKCNF